jgi:hypothetical protein
MTRAQRLTMVAVALVIVVVGFIALRPGSDSGDKSSDNAQTTTNSGTTNNNSGTTNTGTGTGGPLEGAPRVATINVVNGKADGGIKTITFSKGDQIRLKVNSDTADEVHIHGYDIHKDVDAGGSVRFTFPASIDGRFEIELEDAKEQIAQLEVNP